MTPDELDPSVFSSLRGTSPAMDAVRHQLTYAAASGASVMLVGEPGTGKNLAVRLLAGGRACQRVGPAQLTLETLAAWLTPPSAPDVLVLLDPQDLVPAVQARLARLLADPAASGVGRLPRLISLCRTDPAYANDGRPPLRPDLYHLLSPVFVRLPPLRHRGGDLEHLLRWRLADRLGVDPADVAIDPAAARRLAAHGWPDNVRELLALADDLAHRLSRPCPRVTESLLPVELGAAALLGTARPMHADPTPAEVHDTRLVLRRAPPATEVLSPRDATPIAAAPATPFSEAIIPLAELERRAVEHALRVCDGDIELAARRLGLSPDALAARLRATGPATRSPSAGPFASHPARDLDSEDRAG
ncbi:MAG: helix-turn-helix domain-containing protein [Tepidisphaerales bacterium]